MKKIALLVASFVAFIVIMNFNASDASAKNHVLNESVNGVIVEKNRGVTFSYSQANWSQTENMYYLSKNEAFAFADDLDAKAKKIKQAQKVLKKIKFKKTIYGKLVNGALTFERAKATSLAKEIRSTVKKTSNGHVQFTIIETRYATVTSPVKTWDGKTLDYSEYSTKTKQNNVTGTSFLTLKGVSIW